MPPEEIAAKEREIAECRDRLDNASSSSRSADDSLTQQHDLQANLVKEIRLKTKELKELRVKKIKLPHTPSDLEKHNCTVSR